MRVPEFGDNGHMLVASEQLVVVIPTNSLIHLSTSLLVYLTGSFCVIGEQWIIVTVER